MSHGGTKVQSISKKINPNDWDFLKLNSKKNEDEKRMDEEMFGNLCKNVPKSEIRKTVVISRDQNAGTYIVCELMDIPFRLEYSSGALKREPIIDIILAIFDESFSNQRYLDMIEKMQSDLTYKIRQKITGAHGIRSFERKLLRIQKLISSVTKIAMVQIFIALNLLKEHNPKYKIMEEMDNIMIFIESLWKAISEDRYGFAPQNNTDLFIIHQVITFGKDFRENYQNYQKFSLKRCGWLHYAWCFLFQWWKINSPRIFGTQKNIILQKSGLVQVYHRLIIYSNYSLLLK